MFHFCMGINLFCFMLVFFSFFSVRIATDASATIRRPNVTLQCLKYILDLSLSTIILGSIYAL